MKGLKFGFAWQLTGQRNKRIRNCRLVLHPQSEKSVMRTAAAPRPDRIDTALNSSGIIRVWRIARYLLRSKRQEGLGGLTRQGSRRCEPHESCDDSRPEKHRRGEGA